MSTPGLKKKNLKLCWVCIWTLFCQLPTTGLTESERKKTHLFITYCIKHSSWGYISLLNITYCRAMKNRRILSETRSKFSSRGWRVTAVYNSCPFDDIWMPKMAKCDVPKQFLVNWEISTFTISKNKSTSAPKMPILKKKILQELKEKKLFCITRKRHEQISAHNKSQSAEIMGRDTTIILSDVPNLEFGIMAPASHNTSANKRSQLNGDTLRMLILDY